METKDTNITGSFEHLAEESKQDFQVDISVLLDIRYPILEKLAKAKEQGKAGIFLTIHEGEVFERCLFDVCTSLMASFEILNRTNIQVHRRNEYLLQLAKGRTPNLKSLLKW